MKTLLLQRSRRLLLLCSILCCSILAGAQTLSPGDLAMIGWNTYTNQVDIVALAELPSGTVIKFTDYGWNNSTQAFTGTATGDGVLTWTVGTKVSPGTILRITYLGGAGGTPSPTLRNTTTNTDITSEITAKVGYTVTDPITNTGDGLFIYQGANNNPYFIYGFNNTNDGAVDATGWNTVVSMSLRDSNFPDGNGSQNTLTKGTTAVGMTGGAGFQRNVQYNGPTTFVDKATWLARLNDRSNWTGDNTSPGSTSNGVTTAGSTLAINVAPVFASTSPTTLAYCQNGGVVNLNTLLKGYDANSGQTLTWSVNTAPAHSTLGGFPYATTSTGDSVTPAGLTLTPVSTYSGTDVFVITLSDGTASTTLTVNVTANAAPAVAAITGTTSVCAGLTTQLADATAGGSWSSSNTGVATVDASGLVTGVSTGTATITYTYNNGTCSNTATTTVTVNALPAVAAITGTTSVCAGFTTQLADATSGGSWSSDNTGVATVSASGLVTGVSGGTATITYTYNNGTCSNTATATVTVNALPAVAAITGANNVCVGSTTQLTDATSGGSWSVDSASLATVDASGLVTGISAGIRTITYTYNNGTCSNKTTTTVTVNALPTVAAITGTTSVCAGLTTQLADATSGGSWSSDNTGVATVDASGLVTGVSAGTATITYTYNNGTCSNIATASVTVNALPAVATINGTTSVCVGLTTQLADATSGGSWSSDNTGVATVDASGLVTGVSAGTATITYTYNNGTCTNTATATVTVNALPAVAAITGTTSVCAGLTTQLADATSGGSWSSDNTGVATVDASGLVTGVSAGTATITYTYNNGTCTNTATTTVTVNALPAVAAITGTTNVCAGLTTQLADATSGGSWSSDNTGVATIDASGLVTGVSAGTATITYTYNNGTCSNIATAIVTVNALPTVAAITGTTSVCAGLTTQLADATAGGSWSSDNTGVATVDASGLVTGVSAGTATITYTYNNGTCTNTATATVTVNALPVVAAITGTTSVCTGLTTQLADATAGGSWSSDNTGVATVDASGLVTGVSAGTATITYTYNNGTCTNTATATVTVNALPAVAAITGTTSVCAGLTTQLADATSGGSWSSDNTGVATVDASGLVTGVSAGTATITYTYNNGTCTNMATATVTVNALPAVAAITGTTSVCTGLTTQLADATSGGSWSSDNTGVATVDASGLVTGVSSGTVTITYTYNNGTCSNTATASVTVNALPAVAAITGTTSVCAGLTTQLADATSGGSWSSDNTGVATIDASGLVTGVSAGTATITYTYNNGTCINTATTTVTVNALPALAAITGTTNVCAGLTTQLADATSGGSWSSDNTGVATIDASGLVTGVSAGTATITYTYNNGTCTNTATATVTVNALPAVAAIIGTTSVCAGLTTQLADATSGGSWSSDNTGVATVDASGLVTGVSSGTATITYTYNNGTCSNTATASVTVNALPTVAAITGTTSVCAGLTTQLADATAGGSWSSDNTGVATVDASGLVTGVSAGTATITYTYNNGTCTNTATATVTVNALPTVATITGTTGVCAGLTTQLADATAGGSWSSDNTGVATIDAGGLVTGVSAGTATITYTFNNGTCNNTATATMTVNALPVVAAITGTTSICAGLTTQLADATAGGNWSSDNTTVATIDVNGLVTGVSAGAANITYTYNNGTCTNTATATVTVNALPAVAAITGTTSVCAGLTTQLADATAGGSWSSNNTAVATVNASGLVTGVSAGTATITYTYNNGTCSNSATALITVNARPAVASITGASTVCKGATTQLSDATSGGSWSSSNTAVATVSTNGLVTGVSAGVAGITYTYSNGTCSNIAAISMQVKALPVVAAITGTTTLCAGATTQLADATAGGTWISGATTVATVDAAGLVTGVSAGTATITYTYNNGSCTNTATTTVTVNALPIVAAIIGTTAVCEGFTTQLSDATTGGSWSSSNTAVATVDAGGLVSGVSAGTATITYAYNNGTCSNAATATITVNALPAVAAITGTTSVCAGLTTQLADVTTGGSWSSGNTAVATIDANGVVTGVSAGTTTITYTYNNGTCSNTGTTTVTVNALPVVATITGTTAVCQGFTTQLSDATSGGIWSSSNTAVATIDASGLIAGVSSGTTTIIYTYNNGTCSNTATATVTVNALPTVAAITGTTSVCAGLTTQLSDATSGGSWNSDNTAVATVDVNGLVTGVSSGTATITYTYNNGTCTNTATATVTVNALPTVAAITGTASICAGLTTQLADATSGGSWSSDNAAVATVDANGLVTGVSSGTATITYTYNNGTCSNTATTTVTVNALPTVAAITGTASVCVGLTTQLSDATSGGSWSSSNTAVATVDAVGLVSGVSAGTATITYSYNDGTCSNAVTATITVNALPAVAAITGTTSVCTGLTTQLADITAGGNWSTGNTAVATIDANGVVTGVSAGTAAITYTYNNGTCSNAATTTVTVNALPVVATITGTTAVCEGFTTQLSDATTGGSWSSSNTATATVDANGVVTGVSSGTATITYTYNNGTCSNAATATITVNALPAVAAIAGTTGVCAGQTTQLANATTGGSWSSDNTGVATVAATGLVTGVSAGTATITYTYNNGTCSNAATAIVTVNALPAVATITGTTSVCAGLTTQLADATTGGSWSSNNTAVVTVDASGLVTGVSAGTATITYIYNNGTCSNIATTTITVNALPVVGAITGSTIVCAGLTTPLADATTGGSWNSSNTAVATIDANGLVTGVSAGTATITYIYNNGTCSNKATTTVTVNALPTVAAITGTTTVCAGITTPLSDATTGGTWSSSNTAVATVSASGLVAGVSAGSATITYTYNNGTCSNTATVSVTVYALPTIAAITGTMSVCTGLTTQLADATAGGSWSSSNTAVATIDASGLVTGIAAGTATITYTYNNGTCGNTATTTVTVNALPTVAAITGATTVCAGLTTQLADATTGGSWISSNTAVGIVNASGLVTGVSAGTTTITYTYNNGACSNAATTTVTVNALPAVAAITGTTAVCAGMTTQLADATTGGSWSSSNNAVAAVSTSGLVTGVSAGGATITYTYNNGACSNTATAGVTVNALPAVAAITGNTNVCTGLTTQLADATAGGSWSSSNTGVATVNASGLVTGVSAGTATITYAYNNGTCSNTATTTVTVSNQPLLPVITLSGSLTFCLGGSVTLSSSATIGNQWLLNGVAITGATGNTYTAALAGIYTVRVTNGAGCFAISLPRIVIVLNLPIVLVVPNRSTDICTGENVVFTSTAATGNQWYLNSTVIPGATAQSYTASTAGSYSVAVTNGNGCIANSLVYPVTVKPLPVLALSSAEGRVISKGDETRLLVTANTPIAAVSWSPASSLRFPLSASPIARPFDNTIYRATVTNTAGCTASDTIGIQVEEDFKITPKVIITPNGDGINDRFVIQNIDAYPDNVLRIFDRTGKLVYEKEHYSNDWEGKTGLRVLITDTYFYVLSVKGRIIKKGAITLIR